MKDQSIEMKVEGKRLQVRVKYRIVTEVEIRQHGQILASATAVPCPKDQFSHLMGATVALGRAVKELPRTIAEPKEFKGKVLGALKERFRREEKATRRALDSRLAYHNAFMRNCAERQTPPKVSPGFLSALSGIFGF